MIKNKEFQIKDLKAVIFDMDGVLVDSEPVYYKVEQKLFSSLGLEIPPHVHRTFVGLSMESIWHKIKLENKLDHSVEELISLHKKLMIRGFKTLIDPQPIDGIIDLLQLLKKNQIKIALASSSSHELINLVLERTNLKDYFNFVVSSEDVKAGKPEPDIFLEALRLLEMEKNQVLIIEDSANGIRAARQAGIFSVAYLNPNSGKQDLQQADLIIDNFSQYHALLQQSLQQWN